MDEPAAGHRQAGRLSPSARLRRRGRIEGAREPTHRRARTGQGRMRVASPTVVHVERPLIAYDLHVDTIPPELRRRRQWVTFVVERKDDGKLTKIPKIAGADANADTTES